MKYILSIFVLLASSAAQQIQLSGGASVAGNVTTSTAPQVITPQPLTVTPAQYSSGVTGTPYGLNGQGVTISAANGSSPYSCAISVGTLPTGLSLASCLISGTPTVAGTSNFTLQVTDSKGATGTLAASITITSSLAIVQTGLGTAVKGTAYSNTFTATGGTGGYVFSLSSGTLPPGLTLVSPTLAGTPTTTGTFSMTVTVTDSGANTASWSFTLIVSPAVVSAADNRYAASTNQCVNLPADGPANPLAKCFYTPVSATPSPGTVRTATATTLGSVYAAAACGDTIQVTAGTSFSGVTTLTGKNCPLSQYITIESAGVSNPSFPAEGTRTSPCWSNTASLPNRPAYPCASPAALTAKLIATNGSSALVLQGADHIRFIGLEITRVTTPGAAITQLIDLSNTTTQTNHIIFDRVWIHGVNADGTFPQTNLTDTSTTRGIYLGQSNNIAVIDSYMSDFYDNGVVSSNGNTDAQCMAGGFGSIPNTGWGVYKFVNNHCEASGEGLLIGGGGGPALTPAGCTIMVNCNVDTPTDLEVRRNLFFKPLSWNGNTTVPGSTGWPVVKNGLEMKTGVRALFEGNVIENCWYNAQGCAMFVLAPKNQSSGGSPNVGTCPTCVTNDFTYRYNYSYNIAAGIGVFASMDSGCANCQSQGMNRVSLHDNLIADDQNLGVLTDNSAGDAIEILATDDSTAKGLNKMQNVTISHNTFVKATRSLIVFGGPRSNLQIVNLTMQNNLWPYGTYGWIAVGNSPIDCELAINNTFSFYVAITSCVSNWTVDHNAEFNWSVANGGVLGNNWPTNGSGLGNFFYTGTAGPQFTSYGSGDSSLTPGNYALQNTSPLHNAASDGVDVGANVSQLVNEISGVAAY